MASGSSMIFTRDASRLLVRTPSGVHFIDIGETAPPLIVPLPGVSEIAQVVDEIWAVAGVPPVLHRLSRTGDRIGEPRPLGGAAVGRLRPASLRDVGAVWSAGGNTFLSASGAEVTELPLPGDADCILPISAIRWVVCRRGQVSVSDTTSERWSAPLIERDDRVIDGAILFEGRSAALVVARPGEPARQLLVVGLHAPVVQHRLTLSDIDAVRFAQVRGFAMLRAARRRVVLVDLRFGRVLKEHDAERDLADLAIDDAAQHIALGFDDGEIVHLPVRTLLAAAPPRTSADDPDAEPPPPAPPLIETLTSRAPPPASAPESPTFHLGHAPLGSVDALAPRPQMTRTPGGETLALLDRYRDLALALVGRAIALAWDQGRLAFPNEGNLPFRTEVAGLLGRGVGMAPGDVEEAEHAVVRALSAVRAAEAATGARVPPLEAIAREFGLSTMARLILILVAAPGLWGELARLYGILANDEDRPLCDELLVWQILGAQTRRHDVARELDREAPLVRHGLLRLAEGRMRPFVPLTAEPIVQRLLEGAEANGELDEIKVVDATRTFDELFIPAAVKDDIVRAMARPQPAARVAIRGRVGSGRHTLLATLAAAAGRRLGVIDAAPMIRNLRTRPDLLRNALRRAHLVGLLPCIDGLETIGSDDQLARDLCRETLRAHPGPLAVSLPWDAEAPLDPGYIAIDLPALSIEQRLICWNATLAQHGLTVREPEDLALRYRVGPGVITRVCAEVAAGRPEGDAGDALEEAVRQHLERRLSATASRVTRLATWSKVILPPDIQDSLLELIARIRHRRTVFETWGFDEVMSTSRGVTALFQGGPGTGKTLVASAIANELGMDLYRVDLSRIMSKWIGETEQNLARLFDAAEDGHTIILFDEADSLFAKRTEVRSSVDRYANLEVNYLLQRLDSFEGIAILTTNFGTAIDSAFKRRLSFRLTFPFPDEEMREQLWRVHLPASVPKAGDFDLGALARRYRLSGGYIRNATLRAAFLAAEEHTPMTYEHLERAIKAEFREIGKLADSGVLE